MSVSEHLQRIHAYNQGTPAHTQSTSLLQNLGTPARQTSPAHALYNTPVAASGAAGVGLNWGSPMDLNLGALVGANMGGSPIDAVALQQYLQRVYYEAYYKAYLEHFTAAM